MEMSDCLSQKYNVVVTNPPYMGAKGMNADLATFLKTQYPDYKSDLFSAMIVRCTGLALEKGELGFMSPFVWMFLSSYEKLRKYFTLDCTISSLIQLEYSGFADATVPICTFTLHKNHLIHFKGSYIRLSDFRGPELQKPMALEAIHNHECGWFYLSDASNFTKIPGSPIAYWLSDRFVHIFEECPQLASFCKPAHGLTTSNNNRFLRQWYEVPMSNIGFGMRSALDAQNSGFRWFPYNKGGEYRRWYGNQDYVVNWANNGVEIKATVDAKYPYLKGNIGLVITNESKYFLPAVTWSFVSSSYFGTRYSPKGFIFDVAGSSVFPEITDINLILGMLCSSAMPCFLQGLNPTLNYQVGDVQRLPLPSWTDEEHYQISSVVEKLIAIEKQDWDSQEISWNFKRNEIVEVFDGSSTLKDTVEKLQQIYRERIKDTQELEERNNEHFIRLYGLEGELSPEHSLSQVTLCCNPYYFFAKASEKTDDELWAMQRCELMKDLISYAVGCMFGRYSLEKEGVILGYRQGESLEDYQNILGKEGRYLPDDDNIIPVLDEDYFDDDITIRFKEFLKLAFGAEHYAENLLYVEECLNLKHKSDYSIRNYFTAEFYSDHLKRYKKRPIYWLFQSPDNNFRALVYMHRYKGGQVSRIRKNYLLSFKNKLDLKLSQLNRELGGKDPNNQGENVNKQKKVPRKGGVVREIEKIKKIQNDLQTFDSNCFYQLAQDDPAIDLNDGVRVNYLKFGTALKKIPGLEKKED